MSTTDAFATLADLQDRLDWTLSADEVRQANAALEDASNLARAHGREWDSTNFPALVRTVVLAACQRFMRNPDGYVQSRAGDEHVMWSDTHKQGGSPTFTSDEVSLLARLAGNVAAFGSAPVSAWGTRRRRHREFYVPVIGPGKPFPVDNFTGRPVRPLPLDETPGEDFWGPYAPESDQGFK